MCACVNASKRTSVLLLLSMQAGSGSSGKSHRGAVAYRSRAWRIQRVSSRRVRNNNRRIFVFLRARKHLFRISSGFIFIRFHSSAYFCGYSRFSRNRYKTRAILPSFNFFSFWVRIDLSRIRMKRAYIRVIIYLVFYPAWYYERVVRQSSKWNRIIVEILP